jgi:hypothetical protein
MKAKKKKRMSANKKKPSITEQAKGGINSGKNPALSTLDNHVKKTLRNKEDNWQFEIRDCAESQHLTVKTRMPKACSAPVCFRKTVTAKVEPAAALVLNGVMLFSPV